MKIARAQTCQLRGFQCDLWSLKPMRLKFWPSPWTFIQLPITKEIRYPLNIFIHWFLHITFVNLMYRSYFPKLVWAQKNWGTQIRGCFIIYSCWFLLKKGPSLPIPSHPEKLVIVFPAQATFPPLPVASRKARNGWAPAASQPPQHRSIALHANASALWSSFLGFHRGLLD